MSRAFVICMNDYPEHVVLSDQNAAKRKLTELQEAYRSKNWGDFRLSQMGKPVDEAMHEAGCHWHIKEVEVTE